jgi:hypothetical protein
MEEAVRLAYLNTVKVLLPFYEDTRADKGRAVDCRLCAAVEATAHVHAHRGVGRHDARCLPGRGCKLFSQRKG